MKTSYHRYTSLDEALREARREEARKDGQQFFVIGWYDNTFEVSQRMPLMGKWWTSDAIQHGG